MAASARMMHPAYMRAGYFCNCPRSKKLRSKLWPCHPTGPQFGVLSIQSHHAALQTGAPSTRISSFFLALNLVCPFNMTCCCCLCLSGFCFDEAAFSCPLPLKVNISNHARPCVYLFIASIEPTQSHSIVIGSKACRGAPFELHIIHKGIHQGHLLGLQASLGGTSLWAGAGT